MTFSHLATISTNDLERYLSGLLTILGERSTDFTAEEREAAAARKGMTPASGVKVMQNGKIVWSRFDA